VLRRAREDTDLTQEQLAAQSNVSVQMVRRLEAGASNPTLATLSAIADPLGLSVADLLFDGPRIDTEGLNDSDARPVDSDAGEDQRRRLELWVTYTRENVHDIFDPTTTFTPQTGAWGISGFVSIPGRPGDFVFFVTFGATQGDHDFDESISEDGVLTWQSQPQQKLTDPRIKKLIGHDELINTIYLFLRTKSGAPYTYLGTLGYLDHDVDREKPVYFTWQLLSGPPPNDVLNSLGLELKPTHSTTSAALIAVDTLIAAAPPEVASRSDATASGTLRRKQAVLPGQDAKNRTLGLKGEKLVLSTEIQRLRDAGKPELADQVVHVSVIEGDGAGYDIRSYEPDGSTRHIEVKTTRGPAANAFFVTPNEIDFSRANVGTYVLLRVYEYDDPTNSAMYYEVPGALDKAFDLAPSEFRARLRSRSSS